MRAAGATGRPSWEKGGWSTWERGVGVPAQQGGNPGRFEGENKSYQCLAEDNVTGANNLDTRLAGHYNGANSGVL